MARRKSGKGGDLIGVLVLGIIGLIASVPKQVWYAVGFVAAAWFVLRIIYKSQKDSSIASVEQPVDHAVFRSGSPTARRSTTTTDDDWQPQSVSRSESSKGYRIPNPPKGFGSGRWVSPGEEVEVAGVRLAGGMLYVGSSLPTPSGSNDPCLIDPNKKVANTGDFTERQITYWPSYSEISPTARRAYLNWLSSGRSHPDADIGFVFIYFYGLERRALVDGPNDPLAKESWRLIALELRRLLSIYGDKSQSFRGYATNLLNLVSLPEVSTKLYMQPLPELEKSFELPIHLKLALGQCAADGVPVPANFALAWVKFSPETYLRTPAKRCALEFEKLFFERYAKEFGSGLVLPKNRTKLKFAYHPASGGFHGHQDIKISLGDVPDVSVLTAPVQKLKEVVDAVTQELDPYSRFIGRNPEERHSIAALLQLPVTLWPENTRHALRDLKVRVGDGMILSFQGVLSTLGTKTTLNKDKAHGLARVLESLNIGIEPNILSGAKMPKADDPIVLFNVPVGETSSHSTPAYQAALLTLQLASAVAAADGHFNAAELAHLQKHVESWSHLTPNHQRRLLATLRLLMTVPMSLTSLKKKLEPIEPSSRETIALFMASVAHSDGVVTPEEVKTLEKVYAALGVDSKRVFGDVHSAAADVMPSAQKASDSTGFKLDVARIATLQRDSDKVSNLLANIFQENEVVEAPAPILDGTLDDAEDETVKYEGLLGLDETHAAFARLLLTRREWTRDELTDAASDLDLMLDGALEQLNDASFEKLDLPFTEGEDPVTVNHEVLEKIAA